MQESSSVNIDTSELPPHIVLQMPALSPTMVRAALAVKLYVMIFNLLLVLKNVLFFNFLFLLYPQNQGNIAKWNKKEGDKVRIFLSPT